MANRVILGAFDGTHVLRVSRPGYNVLSTGLTPEQLAFDSRWDEAGNVFAEGSFSIDNGAYPGVTISYGTTLSPAPLVLLRLFGDGGRYMVVGSQVDTLLATSGPTFHNVLFVGETSFNYRKQLSGGFNGTRTVHYTIFRNVYG